MTTPAASRSSPSSAGLNDTTVLRFRAETPKSLIAVTAAAKDLLVNPDLLSVWTNVCIGYTNVFQSRSVEMSMNKLNGWTQAIGDPTVCTKCMDMQLLVDAIEKLITSQHHRVLTSVLNFLYCNSKRLFARTMQQNGQNHHLKIMGVILLSRNFFNLFLHWDQGVRVHFHHILVYRLFEGSRARLGLDIDVDILYYLSGVEAMEDPNTCRRVFDPSEAIQAANSLWRASALKLSSSGAGGSTTNSKGEGDAASDIEGEVREKSSNHSFEEAGNVIDAMDVHAYLAPDSADKTPTGRMRQARKMVMASLPPEIEQRNEPTSENDVVLVEIYQSMIRRAMGLLSEYVGGSASTQKANLRKRQEVICDLDESPADTGGLPRGRAVYAAASLREFAELLKKYYTSVSRSNTGEVYGPATIVMGV